MEMATNTMTEFPDLDDDEYVLLQSRLAPQASWAPDGLFTDERELREYKNKTEEAFGEVQWLHSVEEEHPEP
jgi:hypothetical protein